MLQLRCWRPWACPEARRWPICPTPRGTAGDVITNTVATVGFGLATVTNAMEGVGFLPGGPAAQILAATEATSALGWLAVTDAYAGRVAASALNAGA